MRYVRHLMLTAAMALSSVSAASASDTNWSGVHIGVHAGYGWQEGSTTVLQAGSFPLGYVFKGESDGGIGGISAGYDHRIGNFLIGLAGDISWTDLSSITTDISPTSGRRTVSEGHTDWLATLTARAGIVVGHNWLVYGRGGYAHRSVGSDFNQTFSPTGALLFNNEGRGSPTDGWTVGGGLEWALSRQLAVRAEFDHYKFGSKTGEVISTSVPGGVVTSSPRDRESEYQVIKLGVVLRFGN